MHVPDIQLHETTTLDEAAELMARHAPDARFLAGGTDVLVDLKCGRYGIGHLISINGIGDLRGISYDADGLRIGALTTISQLNREPIIRERFSAILDASTQMAAPQIRNAATVGGNIACAAPCADLPPILTVMRAAVVMLSPKGERRVPLCSFFTGPRQTVMGNDELLTAVCVPDFPSAFGAAYERFGLREGNSIAVAGAAVGLQLDDDGLISDARVVLASVAPFPKAAEAAEDYLIGNSPSEQVFDKAALEAVQAAEPISDVRGSDGFRRELVGVMTRRALATACRRAQEVTP